MNIGKAIKVLMIENDITPADLAGHFNVSMNRAYVILRSKSATSNTIEDVAKFLGVKPSELVERAERYDA